MERAEGNESPDVKLQGAFTAVENMYLKRTGAPGVTALVSEELGALLRKHQLGDLTTPSEEIVGEAAHVSRNILRDFEQAFSRMDTLLQNTFINGQMPEAVRTIAVDCARQFSSRHPAIGTFIEHRSDDGDNDPFMESDN